MKFFTNEEIRDLIVSVLVLALIFSYPNLKTRFFLTLFAVIISFGVYIGVYKVFASKLSCMATFKISQIATLLSFISMFIKPVFKMIIFLTGFIEVMPYKFGRWGIKLIRLTPRDYGTMATAAVSTNLFLAFLFTFFNGQFFQLLSQINLLVAFFNLLPIPQFDGSKIFFWSIWIWVFLFVLTLIIALLVF